MWAKFRVLAHFCSTTHFHTFHLQSGMIVCVSSCSLAPRHCAKRWPAETIRQIEIQCHQIAYRTPATLLLLIVAYPWRRENKLQGTFCWGKSPKNIASLDMGQTTTKRTGEKKAAVNLNHENIVQSNRGGNYKFPHTHMHERRYIVVVKLTLSLAIEIYPLPPSCAIVVVFVVRSCKASNFRLECKHNAFLVLWPNSEKCINFASDSFRHSTGVAVLSCACVCTQWNGAFLGDTMNGCLFYYVACEQSLINDAIPHHIIAICFGVNAIGKRSAEIVHRCVVGLFRKMLKRSRQYSAMLFSIYVFLALTKTKLSNSKLRINITTPIAMRPSKPLRVSSAWIREHKQILSTSDSLIRSVKRNFC